MRSDFVVPACRPKHRHPRKRKTLAAVLSAQGIPQNAVTQIVQALRSYLNLRRLQPEDTLRIHRNPEGAVTKVVYRQSPIDIFEVRREESGWIAHQREVAIDRRVVLVAGTLDDTLFDSIERLGESPQLVPDLPKFSLGLRLCRRRPACFSLRMPLTEIQDASIKQPTLSLR